MKWQFCHQATLSLTKVRVYTPQGVWVCQQCYKAMDAHGQKPYSEVIDNVAIS